MTQIHIDNVRQVRAALAHQVHSIQRALNDADDLNRIGRCGDDPVSRDAQRMLQAKIDTIVAAHRAYVVELEEACAWLDEAARQYGLTDDDTAASFRSTDVPQSAPFR